MAFANSRPSPDPAAGEPWTREVLPFLLLVAAVAAAFGRALWAPFHFDDFALFEDPAIASAEGWRWLWRLGQTRPLTWSSFWLNYQLGGTNPWSWHAVNLAVHALVACLLWACLKRLLPRPAALTAALIFAIHPVQTEAVVYVFARATLLAALGTVAAWRAWLGGKRWQAVVWFFAALLAKEECAAFPVSLALWERARSRGGAVRAPLAVMLALAAAAVARVAVLTATVAGSGAGPQAGVTPLDYALTQGLAILRYWRLLILPLGFSVDPDIEVPHLALGLAAWTLVAASAWFAWRLRGTWPAALWLLGGLILIAPTSSVFPAADLAADRRVYLPLIAWAPLAALALVRTRFPILLAAGAIVLGMLTYARTDVWMNEQTLWEDALRAAPEKVRPRLRLSRLVGRTQAIELLEEARRIAPDDPRVTSEWGRLMLLEGRDSEALTAFGAVVAALPRDAWALNNRGVALLRLGFTEQARADFRNALDLAPCIVEARLNLRKTGVSTDMPENCRLTESQRRSWESPQ